MLGLCAWGIYTLVNADWTDRVAVCRLAAFRYWNRAGGQHTKPACTNFVFNPPGRKAQGFCCDRHKRRHNKRLLRARQARNKGSA